MEKKKMIISTNNLHKVDEIKKILDDDNIEVLSKEQIGLGDLTILEDGESFEENSYKKARGLKDKTSHIVIADDSGLMVDALNGQPGVYSSRYAGEEGNDQKNKEKLIKALRDIPYENRTAKFVSVISVIGEDDQVLNIYGECRGHIAFEARGENGFGYDSLFIPLGYEKTFGELEEEVKNKISHRAKALEELKSQINKVL